MLLGGGYAAAGLVPAIPERGITAGEANHAQVQGLERVVRLLGGGAAAVERAIEACKARGAKRAMPLPVSVPSHCALMRPAAERFAEAVAAIDWQTPQIALVQNVSAAAVTDLQGLKRDLLAQLYSPVRWVESIVCLSAQGVTDLVECGPGKVLSGLNKRCVKGINTHNLDTPDAFAAANAALV